MAITGSRSITLESIKVIFDLNFLVNRIPLKRSNSIDLAIETVVRSRVTVYAVWFFRFAFLSQKLFSFFMRDVTSDSLAYYVLHAIILIQIMTGLIIAASLAIKSEEVKNYFNLLHLHFQNVRRK